jgi:hypothetical protein
VGGTGDGLVTGRTVRGWAGDGDGDDGGGGQAWVRYGEQRRRRRIENSFEVEGILCGARGERV